MDYKAIILEAFHQAIRTSRLTDRRGDAKRRLGLGASGDITYFIDKAVEASILKTIQKHISRCFIVTEESGALGRPDDRPIIIIDPVDGSTNTLHDIPFYSTSIAIADGERLEDIVAAGVCDLVNDDIIIGIKGEGVVFNEEPVHPSIVTDLQSSLVCMDIKIRRGPLFIEKGIRALQNSVKYPRSLGSAALETAYVAIGRVDAFVQPWPRLRSYDCLPSLFLLEEAGGSYKFLCQNSLKVNLIKSVRRFAYVAAGNKTLCNTLLSFFKH